MIHINKLIMGNGAGPVKTVADVEKACKGANTRVMVGAGTVPFRVGNIPAKAKGTFYVHPTELWGMNSLGLPNGGMEHWQRNLPVMVQVAERNGKQLGFNIAGFTPAEYAELALVAFRSGVSIVQINLSCANVWGPDGTRKSIAAEDPELTDHILRAVADIIPREVRPQVEVKVSPTTRPGILFFKKRS